MSQKQIKALIAAACATVTTVLSISPAYGLDAIQSVKLTNRGYALLQTREDNAALQVFVQAVVADPGNLTARRLLARAQLQCGRSTDCIIQLLAISTVQPNVPSDQLLMGRALLYSGKTKEAGEQFLRVLQATPSDTQAMLGLIDVYIAQEQFDKATTLCRHVLATSKNGRAIDTATQKLALIEQCSQKPEHHPG
jgi:thioredoxin-like negative regulator of GroEL